MGKKSGGAPSTKGLEEATAKQIALQKEIYDQTRSDVAPWYEAGRGGLSMLSDLLGISGGSVRDRSQIYDELLPQYTTQQTVGSSNQFIDPNTGQIVSIGDREKFLRDAGASSFGNGYYNIDGRQFDESGAFEQLGYSPYETQSQIVDYEALNAAVDERLGDQATPEGYGSLLERFGMDKFEADPSYQFRQEEGNKALERAMAAQGVTLGGGGYGEINPQVARALQEQNQNLASQEYGNAYNRYTSDNLNTFNMLMGMSNMGQNATGQMAGAGQNYAGQVGSAYTDLAGAQYQAAQANASRPSMFGQLLGTVAPIAGMALGGPLGAAAGGMFSSGAPMNSGQWSNFLARN